MFRDIKQIHLQADYFNMERILHILHADDDEEDRWIFQEGLTEYDASIKLTQFEDGQLLLQYMENMQPDSSTLYAIICDMQMTFVGGLGVLSQIKLIHSWAHVPVIIFSTSSLVEDIRSCIKEGALAFYSKPGTFSESRHIISDMVCQCKNKSILTAL